MSGSTAPALAAVKLGEPTHLSGLSYQLAGGVAHLPTSHEHQPAGSTGLATLPAERSSLFGEVGSSVMMGLAGAGTSGAGQFDSAAASMGLQPVGAHRAIQMQPEPLSATMQRHSAQPTQSAWGPAVPMGLQHAPLGAHPLSQMQSQAPSATILQQVHPAQPSQSAWDPADPIRLQHPPFPEHLHTNSSSAVTGLSALTPSDLTWLAEEGAGCDEAGSLSEASWPGGDPSPARGPYPEAAGRANLAPVSENSGTGDQSESKQGGPLGQPATPWIMASADDGAESEISDLTALAQEGWALRRSLDYLDTLQSTVSEIST